MGLYRITSAGVDGVEQYVGSWNDGCVTLHGKTLTFIIFNSTTNESLYRFGTDLLGMKLPGNVTSGPQKNVLQIIWWTEPYRPRVPATPAEIKSVQSRMYGGY